MYDKMSTFFIWRRATYFKVNMRAILKSDCLEGKINSIFNVWFIKGVLRDLCAGWVTVETAGMKESVVNEAKTVAKTIKAACTCAQQE